MSRCSTGCAALAVHASPARRVPLSLLSAAIAIAIAIAIIYQHHHHTLKPKAIAGVACPHRLIFPRRTFDSIQRLFFSSLVVGSSIKFQNFCQVLTSDRRLYGNVFYFVVCRCLPDSLSFFLPVHCCFFGSCITHLYIANPSFSCR
jgi:hypothetical protein